MAKTTSKPASKGGKPMKPAAPGGKKPMPYPKPKGKK